MRGSENRLKSDLIFATYLWRAWQAQRSSIHDTKRCKPQNEQFAQSKNRYGAPFRLTETVNSQGTIMRIKAAYLAITSSAILMLAGCVQSSDSAANTSLPDSLKANGVVSEIRILSVPANTSPEFKDKLASSLKRALATCTSGTHKLRLDATVYSYKAPNPAMAMLIVTTEGLTGKAQLVEPDTNSVVADISIANTTAGGGLIGIAAMANGEEKMTEDFAYDVCKKGFGRKPQSP